MDGDVVTIIGFMLLIAWVLWLVFRKAQQQSRATQAKMEALKTLIEKTEPEEAVKFLESPRGQEMLKTPLARHADPGRSVLRFIQSAIVFLAVGAGLWLNAWFLRNSTEIYDVSAVKDFRFWGILAVAVAIALFIIAAVTLHFARRWDLFKPSSDADTTRSGKGNG